MTSRASMDTVSIWGVGLSSVTVNQDGQEHSATVVSCNALIVVMTPDTQCWVLHAEIDNCSKNPCGEYADCEDLVDGYKCHCHLGMSGKHCDVGQCSVQSPLTIRTITQWFLYEMDTRSLIELYNNKDLQTIQILLLYRQFLLQTKVFGLTRAHCPCTDIDLACST